MFTHWQYEINTFIFLGILAFFPSNSLVVKHNLAIRVVTGYHEHSECFLQSFWIVVGCQWKWQFTCSIKKLSFQDCQIFKTISKSRFNCKVSTTHRKKKFIKQHSNSSGFILNVCLANFTVSVLHARLSLKPYINHKKLSIHVIWTRAEIH